MGRELRNIRVDRVYKRFLWSFLLVLGVPVIFFVALFTDNYKKIYQEKVINQAEILLDSTMKELERNLENLQSIAVYNNQLSHMQDIAIKRTWLDREIKKTLSAEIVTHSYIDEISYYNTVKRNTVYTSLGTWSIDYYVQLLTGMTDEKMLLEELQSIPNSELRLWIPKQEDEYKPSLQYIVRGGKRNWWIFTLSQEHLKELLYQEDALTVLLDANGRQLYPVLEEGVSENFDRIEIQSMSYEEDDLYHILAVSDKWGFALSRRISKTELFQEVNSLQTYFFIMVALVLLIGAVLVMVLTLYHGYPIKKLQTYCEEKVSNLPKALSGLEVFQFAMKQMEDQVQLLEAKRKRNQLLLQMLYGKDCDTESFRAALKKEGLFQGGEEYRVIVAVTRSEHEGDCNKLLLYLDNEVCGECELHAVDLPAQDVVVIIAGIKKNAEEKLHHMLLNIIDTMKSNAGCELVICAGSPYKKLEEVHLSYQEAITHNRVGERKKRAKLVYCKPIKEYSHCFLYPHVELEMLATALDELDLKKADIVTGALVDIIQEQKENRMACVSLYYDVLNTYYRAHAKLNPDKQPGFLGIDLLEVKDYPDVVQMIHRIRDQFRAYVEETEHESASAGKGAKKEGNVIDDVIMFIVQNRTVGDLSVSMVADYFDMSMSNLSHQFKVKTGRTISDYITEVKFAYAGELLRETDYSVSRIADILGYSQAANFIRKFKQYFGVTPVEYRVINRKGAEECTNISGKSTVENKDSSRLENRRI
ncbi:MAG: helix-turn-helix transcriptional regulator [Lachnospiraceae bacterium]|nr:helix-turn-helix transcriptional regulator [Lachnospiraceae bacterium]